MKKCIFIICIIKAKLDIFLYGTLSFMYVCVHGYVYLMYYVCTYIHVYLYVYVCMGNWVCVPYVYVCTYVYIYVYMCIIMYVYVCHMTVNDGEISAAQHTYVYICMYIIIYVFCICMSILLLMCFVYV